MPLLAGCSSGSQVQKTKVAAGTITIGYAADLPRDRELANGVAVALRQINGLGGIDGALKIKLLVRNAHSDPAHSTRALVRAGARILILPCDVRAQRSATRAARRVLSFATCDYDPALVDRMRRVWAVGLPVDIEAAALMDYAHNQGYEKLYLVRPADADGAQLDRYLRTAAHDRKLHLVASPRAADAVVSTRSAGHTLALLRHHRPVLATDLADSRTILRGDGIVFTTFGFADPGYATDEFYERYRSYYGVRPGSSSAALGYVAIKLFERAVNRADSARSDAVERELRGLKWDSPLGHAEYTGKGRNPRVSVAVVRVVDGKLDLVTRASPAGVPAR
jgi:ABC-type branched-subunit amino acid transport system substrate-binding protein